jgi:hypothetical protein
MAISPAARQTFHFSSNLWIRCCRHNLCLALIPGAICIPRSPVDLRVRLEGQKVCGKNARGFKSILQFEMPDLRATIAKLVEDCASGARIENVPAAGPKPP